MTDKIRAEAIEAAARALCAYAMSHDAQGICRIIVKLDDKEVNKEWPRYLARAKAAIDAYADRIQTLEAHGLISQPGDSK